MLDTKESNKLCPDQVVSFGFGSPVIPPPLNADFGSYDPLTRVQQPMQQESGLLKNDILLQSTAYRLKNSDSILSYDLQAARSGIVGPQYGINQCYSLDSSEVGKKEAHGNTNSLLFFELSPHYFQHKEQLVHNKNSEEVAKLPGFEHHRYASLLQQRRLSSEYCNESSTLLNTQCKDHRDTTMPQMPVMLTSSVGEEAFVEIQKLLTNNNVSKDIETTNFGIEDELITEHQNHSLEDQKNSVNDRVSPVISEKIWDGSLKLNTSTTIHTVAFFRSGEKIQDLNWPDHVEIKGKVRLQAFEKFIQELPRSRNRALTVISLCWKAGSCASGLTGMKEVAKGYKENEKVGFAQIPPGIDLYVCPRSDIIITILAKHGFFKGMAAVEEDQDSLIGCIVWRRSLSSSNSLSKISEGKKSVIQEQQINLEPHVSEKQVISGIAEPEGSGSSTALADVMIPPAETSGVDKPLNVSDSSVTFASLPQSLPGLLQGNSQSVNGLKVPGSYGSCPASGPRPLIPVNSSNFQFQPPVVHKSNSNSEMENARSNSMCSWEQRKPLTGLQTVPSDLPGPPSFPPELIQMLINSTKDSQKVELPLIHHVLTRDPSVGSETTVAAHAPCDGDDDDLPEFDFSAACGMANAPLGRVPSSTIPHSDDPSPPLNEKLSFQAPIPQKTSQPSFGKEGFVFAPKHSWDDDDDDDDDDMPEWCPPDLELPKHMIPIETATAAIASPKTKASSSPGSHRIQDFRGAPQDGLLGPRPAGDSLPALRMRGRSYQASRSGSKPKPAKASPGTHRRSSFKPHHSGRYHRRPQHPYNADRWKRRR
ncbi:hypothetical protein AXF42_Ash019866 [Apostasia shenzhenica]|uniref:Spen paralogue and orthologue SPOC C-terminal domain-containing protein n=1 Tax=Apostasia shenzhenica TaxID=1088818 RepID=A0A2H9ZX24_9ASPA|nr:hypothetical protein AXF42_Ash019866 [Apostasia shenzhenica]